MTNQLQLILDQTSVTTLHFFIIFLRTAAIVSLLPGFGEHTLQVRVKLAVAICFTLIVSPAISIVSLGNEPLEMVRLLGVEIIVGLVLGLVVRMFVLTLQTAGSIAAQSTSLAQLLGGATVEPVPAMGYVLVVSGLALAMALGLHVRAVSYIIDSYSLFPIGRIPQSTILTEWGVTRVAHSFSLAFSLAAPFMIASLIYNLTLGVINRAMPQLMVAFVGAPFTTLGGLFLLFIAAPTMLSAWHNGLVDFLAQPQGGRP